MRVGYARVSSLDQNTARQLDRVDVERMFADRVSVKDTARPQPTEMLAFVRAGNVVLVHSMDRLARNLDDLPPGRAHPDRHRGAGRVRSKRTSPSPGRTRWLR